MRVLAITHGPHVGPGVFEDAVTEGGHELVRWFAPSGGSPPDADAVIVFGGSMHPDEEATNPWLLPELEWLEGELERGTPLLGVCLGSQLLARAAGAPVFRAPEPEIGWFPVQRTDAARADPVGATLPERFDAFEWHSYTHGLPEGAVELARSAVCTQAFRLGRAWGVQFHPEVRQAQVEAWLDEGRREVADPETFRVELRRRIDGWNELGRRLCGAFLEQA